jgi:hypothetical protein
VWGRTAGSLIPHARAVRALMIPMIEAAFRTGPMAPAGGADRSVAGRRATRRRAVCLAAIARGADREEPAAEPTRFLAKRRVHDVGAAPHSNWTRPSNRGTKRADWLGPSEHRGGHRGSGGCSSRPSPRLPRTELTRPTRRRPTRRGRGRCRSYGRADAPTAPCKTAPTRFRTSAHRQHLFREPERLARSSPDFYASTWSATGYSPPPAFDGLPVASTPSARRSGCRSAR